MIRPFLTRALEQVAARLRHDEPIPYLSVSLGGVSPEIMAAVAKGVTEDLTRRAADLGRMWRDAGSALAGTLEPPAEHLARGIVARSSLEDTDPYLIEILRDAGDRWGPLGVARVAAHLTDPDVLVQSLRQGDRGPATPVSGWELPPAVRRRIMRDTLLNHHLERQGGEDAPISGCQCGRLRLGQGWSDHVADVLLEAIDRGRAVTSADPLSEPQPAEEQDPDPGWSEIPAGQATEFVGRQVILPTGREAVPEGPVVLVSARFGNLNDGDASPDVVFVTVAGHPEPYALLPSDVLKIRDDAR